MVQKICMTHLLLIFGLVSVVSCQGGKNPQSKLKIETTEERRARIFAMLKIKEQKTYFLEYGKTDPLPSSSQKKLNSHKWYNSNGQLIKELSNTFKTETIYTYNDKMKLKKKSTYDMSQKLKRYSEYIYEGGLLKELKNYDADGSCHSRHVYSYNTLGLLTERLDYQEEESDGKVTYTYDKRGSEATFSSYDADNEMKMKRKLTHDYDNYIAYGVIEKNTTASSSVERNMENTFMEAVVENDRKIIRRFYTKDKKVEMEISYLLDQQRNVSKEIQHRTEYYSVEMLQNTETIYEYEYDGDGLMVLMRNYSSLEDSVHESHFEYIR